MHLDQDPGRHLGIHVFLNGDRSYGIKEVEFLKFNLKIF